MTEKIALRPHQTELHPVYAKLGFHETPALYDVIRSYKSLPNTASPKTRELHHKALTLRITESYTSYTTKAYDENKVRKAQSRQLFDMTLDAVSQLNFPTDITAPLSTAFLNHSLDISQHISNDARIAAAELGLAIGGESLKEYKVAHLKDRLDEAAKQLHKSDVTEAQITQALFAQSMLEELGSPVTFVENPSIADTIHTVAEDISDFTKAHAKTVGATSVAAVIATTTLISPAAANATTLDTMSSQIQSNEAKTVVSFKDTEPVANAPIDETVTKKTVGVSFDASAQGKTTALASIAPQSERVAVQVSFDTDSGKSASNISLPVQSNESSPSTAVKVSINEQDVSNSNTAIPLPSATRESVVTSDTELTPTEKHLEEIKNAINTDGDIAKASWLIQRYFSIDADTQQKLGSTITNAQFVAKIRDLKTALLATTMAGGHENVEYVNQSLMAVAVLDAAGNNSTILKSKDVLDLIAQAKKPTDAYQAKLYSDTYLPKTNQTFSDDTLLKGMEEFKEQITNAYAYSLMATASDASQNQAIQSIKDAEAEAKRKADAEAEAKAQEANTSKNAESASTEALQHLIDTAPNIGKKRSFIAMKFFMENGYSPAQAVAFPGNFSEEAGADLNPATLQPGYWGSGLAQWENNPDPNVVDRFDKLVAFAKARNKDWTDFDTQIAFVHYELTVNGRTWAYPYIKNATSVEDATKAVFVHYETPGVVVDALNGKGWGPANAELAQRAAAAQELFDAYNTELKQVTDSRAAAEKAAHDAAEQAKKAAEQAKQAVQGMTVDEAQKFFAEYKQDPTSVNYLGMAGQNCDGGPLSNCVSFSNYFVNKYTSLGGMVDQLPGNGSTVAQHIVERNPQVKYDTTPTPDSVFSIASGSQWCGDIKCGHTGVVLGVDKAKDQIIIGEAACNAVGVEWDGIHVYSLALWSNGEHKYAHVGDYLKRSLQ